MTDLIISRKLSITLLHTAQLAAPAAIHGYVGASQAQPISYAATLGELSCRSESLWAVVYSNPQQEAVPSASQLNAEVLTLMISLNIKGVLELRAWQNVAGAAVERTISITG